MEVIVFEGSVNFIVILKPCKALLPFQDVNQLLHVVIPLNVYTLMFYGLVKEKQTDLQTVLICALFVSAS